jgi:hypothetical protein
MAEREGFEPSVLITQYDGLANRCLKPLGHRSLIYQFCLLGEWPRFKVHAFAYRATVPSRMSFYGQILKKSTEKFLNSNIQDISA